MIRDSETLDEAEDGTIGEQLVRVVRNDDPDESGIIRPFVVIDLRQVSGWLGGGTSRVPGLGKAASALTSSPGESETIPVTETDPETESGTENEDAGRGLLSKLFVAGIVVGIAYALRSRLGGGSIDETAEDAADETRSIAQRAADTIQRRGEVAANRIEDGSETVAERIETAGDEQARQIRESGQQLDEIESQAEESIEGTGDSTDEE